MNRVLKEAARLVVGSFVTYVVIAACSAGGSSNPGSRVSTDDDLSRDGGAGNPALSREGGSSEDDPPPSMMDPIIDPVPAANAEPTDGSRLKAIYRVAQDGAREPVAGRWWDSARSEECSWRRAADGVQRCLPTDLIPSASPVFADSGCTQDAVIVIRAYCDGQTPPPYVAAPVIECTPELRSRVLQLGNTTPTVYNRNAEGACVDLSTAYAPSYAFYRATEVPASAFVGSAVEHD